MDELEQAVADLRTKKQIAADRSATRDARIVELTAAQQADQVAANALTQAQSDLAASKAALKSIVDSF